MKGTGCGRQWGRPAPDCCAALAMTRGMKLCLAALSVGDSASKVGYTSPLAPFLVGRGPMRGGLEGVPPDPPAKGAAPPLDSPGEPHQRSATARLDSSWSKAALIPVVAAVMVPLWYYYDITTD